MSQTKAQLLDTLVASLLPASDSSVDIGSNAVRFANIYGDTLYGNGANLTGINTDLVSDTSPQLGGDLDTNSHNISIDDNHRINFGDSSDLHLIHDGTNSYLQNITGVLYINNTSGTATNLIVKANDNIELQPANGETGVKAIANGSVELYHDNSKKLETTSIGITLFGDLKIPDNEELRLGDGNDLQIYHNGSNSYIDSNTGNLYFRGSNGQMLFRPNNSEDALVLKPNGAVELYYDNSKKLETVSGGIAITGRLDCTQGIDIDANNQAFRVGASQNLQLVYTGSEAQIKQLDASQHLKILVKDGVETSAIFKANGAVELYYDNSKKAETYANGFIAHHHLKVMGAQDQNAVIQMFADEGDNTDDQFLMASEHNPNRWVLLGQYVSGWHRYIQVLPQAGVQLYYDDLDSSSPTAKLATTSTGVAISGNATFTDGNKSIYGNGGDMEIYHIADNTNVIRGSGPLTIQSNDNVNFNTYSGGELMGKFIKNGAFEAYYDNSKKFETTSNGATVSVTSGDPQLIVTGPGHALLQLKSTSGTDHCGVNFGDNDDNNAGMIQYTNSNNDMQFHTNGSEKIRLLSGGGLTFNGDTAAANALDDYEEGNWTPSFNANISTSTVTAIYTKVGRKVTAQFYVSTPGTFGQAAGAADTSLVISGLPYAASGNAFHTGVIDVGNGGAAGAYLRVSGGASTMSVLVGSGSIGTARTHLRGNTIGKGDYVIGSITYQTS